MFFEWDWLSGEREFKRAIQLNPNSALSRRRYGELLQALGRFDEAITECKRAQELDPLSPDVLDQLAYFYMLTRKYDESISQYQKVLDLNPNLPSMQAGLAFVYAVKGSCQQALPEYDKIGEDAKVVTAENQVIITLGAYVHALCGRKADALIAAQQLAALSTHKYVDFYGLAFVYAGLSNRDESFRWLEKAYQQRSPGLIYLAVDPFWYGMRSDPRYIDLLRRIGLPQPAA